MRPRDFFEALLRVVGVMFIFVAIADFVDAAVRLTSLPVSPGYTPGMVVTAAVLYLVLGVVMILTTPRISRMFYGRSDPD
jgi:hypothetical protein